MARAATSPVSTPPLPASEGAGTITIDVAAKLLMVTPEWVRRLTKDGWIAKTDRGRYRVVDVVQGYIRFLKDEARRATKTAAHNRLQDGVPLVEAMILASSGESFADATALV